MNLLILKHNIHLLVIFFLYKNHLVLIKLHNYYFFVHYKYILAIYFPYNLIQVLKKIIPIIIMITAIKSIFLIFFIIISSYFIFGLKSYIAKQMENQYTLYKKHKHLLFGLFLLNLYLLHY